MTDNTAGFYTRSDDQATELFYSPTSIYFPDGTFVSADHYQEYSYPVNGWRWFDSDVDAYAFWNLAMPTNTLPQIDLPEPLNGLPFR